MNTTSDNLTNAALSRVGAARMRAVVYARSHADNVAAAEALADVEIPTLTADDWHELEALKDFFADAAMRQALGGSVAKAVAKRGRRPLALLLVAFALVLLVIGFFAGKASATGFGVDTDFDLEQTCDGYSVAVISHPGAVEADVFLWGDATETSNPTMTKVGHITPNSTLVYEFHRPAGQYSGGFSLHYANGREPSNRSYTVIVPTCGTSTTAAPATSTTTVVPATTTTTRAPATTTTIAICSVLGHPEQPPIKCPTTSVAPQLPTSTASTVSTSPATEAPVTSTTDAPHVRGEVIATAPTTRPTAATGKLADTGMTSSTWLLFWLACIGTLVGAGQLVLIRLKPRRQ